MNDLLLLLAKVAAIKTLPNSEVAQSDTGIYCLKCIQEHYPNTWTSIDNGTYYCAKHRGKLMGRYFNPATVNAIEIAGGKPVARADHSTMIASLAPHESLGIHLDRYIFYQVADVTDPQEHKEFISQVWRNEIGLLGYYAIPKECFR